MYSTDKQVFAYEPVDDLIFETFEFTVIDTRIASEYYSKTLDKN